MSKRRLPANRKEYLRLLAQAKKERSRRLIGIYLVPVADSLMRAPYVRDLSYNTQSGLITFHFMGASMQYYVGSEKLFMQHNKRKLTIIDVRAHRLVSVIHTYTTLDEAVHQLQHPPLEIPRDG